MAQEGPVQDAHPAVHRLWEKRHPAQNQSDFARHLGVSEQVLSNWLRAENHPSAQKLAEIAGHMGWSLDWLLLGRRTVPTPDAGRAFAEGAAHALDRIEEEVDAALVRLRAEMDVEPRDDGDRDGGEPDDEGEPDAIGLTLPDEEEEAQDRAG